MWPGVSKDVERLVSMAILVRCMVKKLPYIYIYIS